MTTSRQQNRRKRLSKKFIKPCPNGGYCMNPLCMFGCIED